MFGKCGRAEALALAAFCLLVVLAMLLLVPWQNAVMLGGDEGFEFTKAYLLSEGVALYDPIWNDQPPLHTAITALFFCWLGPEAATARLVAAGFGFLFLWSLGWLVAREAGWLAGLVGIVFAGLAPKMLLLCVSAMLEVPSMAGGLAAAAVLFSGKRSVVRCVVAGLVLGLALQVKLTAGMVLPAMLAALAWEGARGGGFGVFCRRLGSRFWGLFFGAFGGFCLVWAFFPAMSWKLIVGTHFSEEVREGAKESARYAFDPGVFLEHLEVLTAGGLGLVLLLVYRRPVVFPVVLLLTALVVHGVHRPYWSYYYVHFVAPLSWISAAGLAVWLQKLLSFRKAQWWTAAWLAGQVFVFSVVVAWTMVEGFWRMKREAEILAGRDRVEDHKMIWLLRERRGSGEWIYTARTELAFHAGVKVIPELAVVPRKRCWAYGFDDSEKIELWKRYEPELLLLTRRELKSDSLAEFLAGYRKIAVSDSLTLFAVDRAKTDH